MRCGPNTRTLGAHPAHAEPVYAAEPTPAMRVTRDAHAHHTLLFQRVGLLQQRCHRCFTCISGSSAASSSRSGRLVRCNLAMHDSSGSVLPCKEGQPKHWCASWRPQHNPKVGKQQLGASHASELAGRGRGSRWQVFPRRATSHHSAQHFYTFRNAACLDGDADGAGEAALAPHLALAEPHAARVEPVATAVA